MTDISVTNQKRLCVTRPTICVTAPARLPLVKDSDEIDAALLEKGFDTLKGLGWNVITSQNLQMLEKGFAGDDRLRARCFEEAFDNPQVDVVLGARGGYGTTRLMELLPWEKLAESPAVFVGLSDLTAVNLALMRHNRASWQGPVVTYFAKNNELCQTRFMKAMTSPVFELSENLTGDDFDVEGPVWGGNLTMLVSLLGTDYFPKKEQIAGGILYIEDVNEPAWRIERMLSHLLYAGVLTEQQALIVGAVSGHDRWQASGKAAFKLEYALDWIRQKTGIRIATGLAFGHIPETLTLPVGVWGRARMTDGHFEMRVVDAPLPTEYPQAQTANAPLWWV